MTRSRSVPIPAQAILPGFDPVELSFRIGPTPRCHLCAQDGAFGYGPPGWTRPFRACFAHRPPLVFRSAAEAGPAT